MRFRKFDPAKENIPHNQPCIVKCPEYCSSGYHIALWDGEAWITDAHDDITEYVTEFKVIED